MKKISLVLFILFFLSPVFARQLKGVITSAGKGVAGVLVTDGTNITKSDAQGCYTLHATPQAEFVYIIQPSGYQMQFQNGACRFYAPIEKKNNKYNFELTRLPQDRDFVLLAMADVQTSSDKHLNKLREESIPDLQETIAGYPAGTPIFGISLGDIVWDNFDHFALYKKEIESLNIPFFAVIGNHDHDKDTPSEAQAEDRYKKEFGPTYYASCLGKHWCIILDNIAYKGNKVYDNQIDAQQIEWLKKLTRFIPAGSPVILGMHATLLSATDINGTKNAQEVVDILKDYPVHILSGHTHINVNIEHKNVYEHNVAAICGSWWMPVAGKDGTPKGYEILEGKGDRLSWVYKSTGKNRNYQMKLYPKKSFPQADSSVVAHVWNHDSAWKIEWLEDGKPMGAMRRFTAFDPDYTYYANKHKVGPYKHPVAADNYFAATPSSLAREVIVKATDRFGNIYCDTLQLNTIHAKPLQKTE